MGHLRLRINQLKGNRNSKYPWNVACNTALLERDVFEILKKYHLKLPCFLVAQGVVRERIEKVKYPNTLVSFKNAGIFLSLRVAFEKIPRFLNDSQLPMIPKDEMLNNCFYNDIKTYSSNMGITKKSNSKRFILDRYRSTNFSGSSESCAQKDVSSSWILRSPQRFRSMQFWKQSLLYWDGDKVKKRKKFTIEWRSDANLRAISNHLSADPNRKMKSFGT